MAADEIFILILIVISVGFVAGMAIHSRRQQAIVDSSVAASPADTPGVSQATAAAASDQLQRKDRTRPRRRER